MKLTISKNANPNYLAKIVEITAFMKHPNADKLKLASVEGFTIALNIDSPTGIYIYFPVECQISEKYLHENNLYRINTKNQNINAIPGFFEENGRVKCINLRKFASEGLLMPVSTLITENAHKYIGTEFDTVNEELLVKKYIIPTREYRGSNSANNSKKVKYEDTIVEEQFRFHPDTLQLKKSLHVLTPDTRIQITHKFHGTSAIFCNLLVKKKLSLYQKLLKSIGGDISTSEYKTFCSSRKVVKDPELNKNLLQGYYKCDIWNLALEVIKPFLTKGMTIYAEIVGYMPDGAMIQKNYDYGCEYKNAEFYQNLSPQQMYEANLFKIYIYRITHTTIDGKVYEMSANTLQQFCKVKGLLPVIEDYFGEVDTFLSQTCKNPYLEGLTEDAYEEHVLKCLVSKYLEKPCAWSKNKVPGEGVVIRIDQPKFEAYKLKSLSFLTHESKMLDEGIIDIESNETE